MKPFARIVLASCLSFVVGCSNSMRENDDDLAESGSSSWNVELGVGIRGVCEIGMTEEEVLSRGRKIVNTPLARGGQNMLYYIPLFGATGLWRNWLAHWTVDPGVAGSSPVDPAIE